MKCSFTNIRTEKMANLQDTIRGLQIIAFILSYGGCYQSDDIFELLLSNPHLTLLPLKRWPICKIGSHVSESTFSTTLKVPIITAI